MKRLLLLFSIVALVSSALIIPAFAAESLPDPIYSLDLSRKDVGLLTDSGLTNYSHWAKSDAARVSINIEDDLKYINIYDNDADLRPAIRVYNVDFLSGIVTIAFDLRINEYGSDGPIFELYDVTSGKSYVRIDFDKEVTCSNGKSLSKLPYKTVQGEFVRVLLLVDCDNNNYTLYYDGVEVMSKAVPRLNSDGSVRSFLERPIDLELRGNKYDIGCDFDVASFVVYAGDQSPTLVNRPDQTAGSIVSSFTQVFGSVGSWIAGQLGSTTSLFWNAGTGTLTFLGVLAVCGLALAVILLLVFLVVRFLRLRG